MYENVHPKLALVLLFVRTEEECRKGLLCLVNVEHDTWRSLLNRKFCCKRGGSSQIEHLLGMLCKVRSLLVLA